MFFGMGEEWSVPGWSVVVSLGLLLLVLILAGAALVRSQRRTTARIEAVLSAAQAESDALRSHVEAIERRLAPPAARVDSAEYKITMLGEAPADETAPDADAPVLPASLFADLVLREGVVQAASLAAGLRRALAPQTRNRIRFEMRREVKRARKQRRADIRVARQEHEARRRAGIDLDGSAA